MSISSHDPLRRPVARLMRVSFTDMREMCCCGPGARTPLLIVLSLVAIRPTWGLGSLTLGWAPDGLDGSAIDGLGRCSAISLALVDLVLSSELDALEHGSAPGSSRNGLGVSMLNLAPDGSTIGSVCPAARHSAPRSTRRSAYRSVASAAQCLA